MLAVVATNFEGGSLRADGVIEIKFNRLLLPSSVTRQSVTLTNAAGQIQTNPAITYDPVLQVVRIASPSGPGAWLTPNQPYKVTIGLPLPDGSNLFALRAIDGAQFDPNSKREFAFIASPPTFISPRPTLDFCADVYATFQKYCTSGCHGADVKPYESLLLDTAEGILRTARGHLSQQANTGASSRNPDPAAKVFGIDMPIIDPGNPGNSYLIYKMLLLSESKPVASSCFGYKPNNPILDGGSFLPAEERTRLSNLMTGQMMPPLSPFPTVDEIERISEWIAQGAQVEPCLACVPPPDAGMPTMDAGMDAGSDVSTDATMDADMDGGDDGG